MYYSVLLLEVDMEAHNRPCIEDEYPRDFLWAPMLKGGL